MSNTAEHTPDIPTEQTTQQTAEPQVQYTIELPPPRTPGFFSRPSAFWLRCLSVVLLGMMAWIVFLEKKQPRPMATLPSNAPNSVGKIASGGTTAAIKDTGQGFAPAAALLAIDSTANAAGATLGALALDSAVVPAARLLPVQVQEGPLFLANALYTLPTYNKEGRLGNGYNGQDPILTAEKWLWKDNFPAAFAILDSVGAQSPDFNAGLRVRAHLLFRMGKIGEATKVFQQMKAIGRPKVSDGENDWYLLLCYLANYRTQKGAFDALSKEILVNTKHSHRDKVLSLTEKMKVLKAERKI